MVGTLGGGMTLFLENLGGLALFCRDVVRSFLKNTGSFRPVIHQIAFVSFRSMPTVIFAGVFVGAILVLQFNLILVKYDAQSYLGGLNTSAVVREVGPLIISFLLAGKVGAFTTAELGTMRVTEQIDAIECLGVNPIQYLIVPRFLGIVISSVILLAIGLVISVGGSMLVASAFCDINVLQYATSVPRFTGLSAIGGGLLRSVIYSSIVAAVSTYYGYNAKGGARGVGKAVNSSAIYICFYVVLAEFLTGNLLEMFGK